ncbi:caspase-7-like isoform X2 [Dendronephthya gigantea]|uniref:caspase-7-like isoform X2 n=1 Tax=Dendronephthya gigantea TaxID=151771 RepID=UPI00106CFC05|nr:caspase-7-like isoform X2 [Dendronephthya gigantea]
MGCSCQNTCQKGSGQKRRGCPCKDAGLCCDKHCTCGTKFVCKNRETEIAANFSGSLNLDDNNDTDSICGFKGNTPTPDNRPSKKGECNKVHDKCKRTRKITTTQTCQLHQIKKGYALVIHNIEFIDCDLENREGSRHDLQAIEIFCKEAGLTMDVQENLEVKQIRAHCRKLNKKNTLKSYDGFVCFILSHGNSYGICGKRGEIIGVHEIVGYFKENKDLLEKPKLFFIQACRGDDIEDDGNEDNPSVRLCPPDTSDILIAHSTMEGEKSYKHSAKGSWFIQTLMKSLDAYVKTHHLLEIMTTVNDVIAGSDFMGERQMPVQVSTLTKFVCFNQYAKPF